MNLRILACTLACMIVAPLLADQVDYTYDALGRLDTVTYSDGTVVDYDYDAAGNRTAHLVSQGGDNPINDSIPTLGVGDNLIDLTT